jgi:NAD dependent epimerase/dehydratase family enzyme
MLARVLERPGFMSIPSMIIKSVLGEMGDELLLTSTRAVPAVLIDNGYPFIHPLLKPALESILSKIYLLKASILF